MFLFMLWLGLAGSVLFYVLAVRRGESPLLAAVLALLLGPFALPLLWRPAEERQKASVDL